MTYSFDNVCPGRYHAEPPTRKSEAQKSSKVEIIFKTSVPLALHSGLSPYGVDEKSRRGSRGLAGILIFRGLEE